MIIQIFKKPHIVGKNYIATVSGEIFTFWIGAQNSAANCCDFDGDLWKGDGLPRRRADGTGRVVRPYFLSFRASPQTGVGIRLPKKEKRIAASLRSSQ